MPSPRRGRQSKSDEERRQYWQTVIRAPGPTLHDTSPIIDTTETSLVTQAEPPSSLTSTKQPSAFRKLLREKLPELLFATLFIPLLLWIAYQLYSINREVGELRSDYKNAEKAQSHLDTKIDSSERRLNDRIDKLLESKADNRTVMQPRK